MKLFALTVLVLLGLSTVAEANVIFPEAAIRAVEGARRGAGVRARARVGGVRRVAPRGNRFRNRGRRVAVNIGLGLLGVNSYGYGGLAGAGFSSYDSFVEEAPVILQQRTVVRTRSLSYGTGACNGGAGAALGGCGSAALLLRGSVRHRGHR